MVPGASGYSNFKKNLPYFAAHGYHALAPDLLGFGLSDKPEDIDYTSTLHVEAMHELIRAKNLAAVVPIGNSLGGSVALEFTLQYPALVSHLLLMAPGGLADPKTFWGSTDGGVALATFARERPRDAAAFRAVLALLVHDAADITDELVAERHPIALLQPSQRIYLGKYSADLGAPPRDNLSGAVFLGFLRSFPAGFTSADIAATDRTRQSCH